jgi:hypothetical protein
MGRPPAGLYASLKDDWRCREVSKRFSSRYSFDVNYTLGKSEATQGGDLAAYYQAAGT